MSWKNHTPMCIRFWKHVRKTPGCWLWIGAQMGKGWKEKNSYGLIKLDWPETKAAPAHRVSWTMHFGEIPPGMMVLHRCDVRSCVNPAHLFLGTSRDNIRDMMNKGRRGRTGTLNARQVRVIRIAVAKGISADRCARHFKISKPHVCRIVTRKSWAHIP